MKTENLDDFSAVLKQAPCRHDEDFARTSGLHTSFQISTEKRPVCPQARQALASVVQTFDSAVTIISKQQVIVPQ